ncbi:MAG: hypothetical protein HPM95_16265 [Alphaproteobacteria bacterium]|nr:hypothetical protein [Alphaproteobacteria bacterium]
MMEREDITPETVAAAEPLAGVDFSDAERAQIAVLMPQQMEATRRLRALGIGNGVPMACRFDPRLPGFRMPDLADTCVQRDRSRPSARRPRRYRLCPGHAAVRMAGLWRDRQRRTDRNLP